MTWRAAAFAVLATPVLFALGVVILAVMALVMRPGMFAQAVIFVPVHLCASAAATAFALRTFVLPKEDRAAGFAWKVPLGAAAANLLALAVIFGLAFAAPDAKAEGLALGAAVLSLVLAAMIRVWWTRPGWPRCDG